MEMVWQPPTKWVKDSDVFDGMKSFVRAMLMPFFLGHIDIALAMRSRLSFTVFFLHRKLVSHFFFNDDLKYYIHVYTMYTSTTIINFSILHFDYWMKIKLRRMKISTRSIKSKLGPPRVVTGFSKHFDFFIFMIELVFVNHVTKSAYEQEMMTIL